MYPTKSMLDYMTEMNRLFPRTSENDMFVSPPTPNSLRSFNQSMAQSSSSTDTSPDSFPDMTAHRFPPETFQNQFQGQREHFEGHRPDQFDIRPHQGQRLDYQSDNRYKPLERHDVPFSPQQMYETPQMRRQRPIVGRKIIAATDTQLTRTDEVSTIWPEYSLPHTPPNTSMDQKYNPNVFYELFPTENKEIEFKTPVKTSPNPYTTSPKMSNMSPSITSSSSMLNVSPRLTNMSQRMAQMSPRMTEMSPRMTEMSPRMTDMPMIRKTSPGPSTSPFTRFSTSTFREPISGPSTLFRPNVGPTKMCTFCRKNGETPLVYMTHAVKEKVGTKNVVTCPILRSHVCSTCGASGDNAHTITYCPVLRSSNNGQPLQSTTITLKNTRIKSNGRRRY